MTAAAFAHYSQGPPIPANWRVSHWTLISFTEQNPRGQGDRRTRASSVATTRELGQLVWLGNRRLGMAAACLGHAEIVVRELNPSSGALVAAMMSAGSFFG